MPRSWAKSATTRFFRGIGKQAKEPWASKPGAGVLGTDYGWKTRESEWFIGLFYGYWYGISIADLFFSDDSPDCYGEDAAEIRDEGGNPFAATRKERDTSFIDTLLEILEKRGLADDIAAPAEKVPKPRKVKEFKPGDVITSRNLRDLPEGAHLRWTFADYPHGHMARGNYDTIWTATLNTFEMVLVGRGTGYAQVRPIVDGRAFGVLDISSSKLYKEDWDWCEPVAEYLGQWDGEVIDVQIDRKAWKPKKSKAKRKTVAPVEGSYQPTIIKV